MSSGPIAGLLAINVILLVIFLFSPRNASRQKDLVFLSLLFFVSGMPALIYQVVWQRALFAIYGINSQSVAVVVTAFMLGLGVGSLVGGSLSILYFVNTSGSAVASYLCAVLLLRNFGQSGSVSIAACVNAFVAGTAYFFARSAERERNEETPSSTKTDTGQARMPLSFAMALAGLSGFIALGFEIAWYRVFAVASADRAPAFAMLLATCLAGIALGSFLTEKWVESQGAASVNLLLGVLLLSAGAISVYLPPLVARFLSKKISYLASAPFFFLASAFVGSVLPVVCQLAILPEQEAGRKVSLVYVSNILGSALGSLGVGFVLTQYFGLKGISLGLGLLAVLLGILVLVFREGKLGKPPAWAVIAVCASLAAIALSTGAYSLLYERLIFGSRPEAHKPFAQIVENRNGVIAITADRDVFGGGVYDGIYNVNPMDDAYQIFRAFALSAFSPSPKRMLVIGIA